MAGERVRDIHVFGFAFTLEYFRRYGVGRSDVSAERFANVFEAIAKEGGSDPDTFFRDWRVRGEE